METESKSASEHSKTLFFVNVNSICIEEVNLSTKGHRSVKKGQSKNEKLLKKLQNAELNLLRLLEHQ